MIKMPFNILGLINEFKILVYIILYLLLKIILNVINNLIYIKAKS